MTGINYRENGPVYTAMPVFGPSGGEVMTVTTDGAPPGMVWIFVENGENPGQLDPFLINISDYQQLISQGI